MFNEINQAQENKCSIIFFEMKSKNVDPTEVEYRLVIKKSGRIGQMEESGEVNLLIHSYTEVKGRSYDVLLHRSTHRLKKTGPEY